MAGRCNKRARCGMPAVDHVRITEVKRPAPRRVEAVKGPGYER
jgi:hypothetical protein